MNSIEARIYFAEQEMATPVPEEWFRAFVVANTMWPGNDGLVEREAYFAAALIKRPPVEDELQTSKITAQQLEHAVMIMRGQHARLNAPLPVDSQPERAAERIEGFYRSVFVKKGIDIQQASKSYDPVDVKRSATIAEEIAVSPLGKELSKLFVGQRDNLKNPWSIILANASSNPSLTDIVQTKVQYDRSAPVVIDNGTRRPYFQESDGWTPQGLFLRATVNAALEHHNLPNIFSDKFKTARFTNPEEAFKIPLVKDALTVRA